jgi:hypothetical protein
MFCSNFFGNPIKNIPFNLGASYLPDLGRRLEEMDVKYLKVYG